jgi:uncharacterized membrane protein YidH (DUF202 family)
MGHLLDTGLAWLRTARAAIVTGLVCAALCLPLGYCHGQRAAISPQIVVGEVESMVAVSHSLHLPDRRIAELVS